MKEQTHKWLSFAQEDLTVAEILYKEGIFNQVCFHSQQAAEIYSLVTQILGKSLS